MAPSPIQLASDRYLALTFSGTVKRITGRAPLVESDAAVYHSLRPTKFKPSFVALDIVGELDQQSTSDRLKTPFAVLQAGEKNEAVFIDPRSSLFVSTRDQAVLEECGIDLFSLRAYSGILSQFAVVPFYCTEPNAYKAAFFGTELGDEKIAQLVANEAVKVIPPRMHLHSSNVNIGSESWRIKKTELIVALAGQAGLRIFIGKNELVLSDVS